MDYTEISPQFTSDFFGLIKSSTHIIITSHIAFDEDSIASVLAVYEIIQIMYPDKDVRIVYSGEAESKYQSFKNFDKIEFVTDLADHLGSTDLLIMLDGGKFSRFSQKVDLLMLIPETICIDHHSSSIDKFTLSLVTPEHSSCSEVIYRALTSEIKIEKPLAEIFLLGILGDTGNFTYLKPSQSETLSIAKKLLDISQVEIQEFQSRYRTISKRVFSIIAELIKNTKYAQAKGWPDFQYSFLERSFVEKNQLSENEAVDAIYFYSTHFIRMIDGYTWGFVLYPNLIGDVVISCRSLPNSVNVRDLMERMKIGGGHNRASGGTFKKPGRSLEVDSGLMQILDWLNSNPPILG